MNVSSYKCCQTGSPKSYEIGELSILLKLISDHSRLQILCILKNGEHCVCQIKDHVSLSQSLISHHLKDLKEAKIVSDRKDGKWVHYHLTDKGKAITQLVFNINL